MLAAWLRRPSLQNKSRTLASKPVAAYIASFAVIKHQLRQERPLLQRFRVAMVDTESKQLSGNVEVYETFVGGAKQGGRIGSGAVKSIVVIAIEIVEPKDFERVRMRHIPDASGSSLVPFVCDVTVSGSVVHTDGWSGYNGLEALGFTRKSQYNYLQAIQHVYLSRAFTV